MASIDVAKLLNKITQDIPGINTVLKALAKWDVSALTDVPDGAMQATTDANNNLTIKKKVSGSYTPVAKLMHDVDKLDGYHASASATANAVAVRNAQGALPGNILGNSATADTAVALAAGSVVPVNQGGTGATTASQARANLGVADGADFATHIATNAGTSVAGHVKLDALAADGSNTAAPGGFGLGRSDAGRRVTDLDTVLENDQFSFVPTATGLPSGWTAAGVGINYSHNANTKIQRIFGYLAPGELASYARCRFSTGVWGAWFILPHGITDSLTLSSSTIAASAAAVKTVNDLATLATSQSTARTSNLSIYISKTGDDSNSGLTTAQAVATWSRAQDIAASLRWSRGSYVIFRFGPGDWGNLNVYGVQFGVSHVRITSFSDTVGSATTLDALPTFGSIQFYSCRGTVYNIVASQVTASDSSYVWVGASGGYCRIARMASSNASYLYVTPNTTIDIVDAGGSSVFYAVSSSSLRIDANGAIINFVGANPVSTATINADIGSTIYVRIGASYVSFTGATPIGNKAYAAFGATIVVNGTGYAAIPGTGDIVAGYGGQIVDNSGVVAGGAQNVGDIVASFATSKAGHLLCNGGTYSRTTYAALFAILGTSFGAGDGSTTFNVPDFRGRTLQGANANLMAVLAAGLPNATGSVQLAESGGTWGLLQNTATPTGAFKKGVSTPGTIAGASGAAGHKLDIDLSGSNSIFGASATVQPPAIAVNIFIKF